MTFFARPILDNEQFVQHTGTTLTLSGQTQIATISGLTLSDGASGNVLITASGSSVSTDGYVFTQDVDGIVKLMPSQASGATVYYGDSPTTCTVGGLTGGTAIYGTSIQEILEDILVPTLYPTLTDPTSSFSITPTTLCYEVGNVIDVTGCTVLDYGCICQDWGGGVDSYRGGPALCYEYGEWGGISCCASGLLPSQCVEFTGHTITQGNNSLSSKVWYSGGTQPTDSAGNSYLSGLTSGCTISTSLSIVGLYPYYYGTYSSGAAAGSNRPPSGYSALITGGTKVISCANATLCVNFNSASDDYIWFALPSGSTAKTKWYVDALNCGAIGGVVSPGANLFPDNVGVTGVSTTCWSGQSYQIYLSNYQTITTSIMELRNS